MIPVRFVRDSISSDDFFDKVRTMRELHTVHAKGAVLNKRDWWVKWTTRPDVRTKWLLETKQALVKAHVSHVWSEWPNRPDLSRFEGLTQLVEIATVARETDKRQAIETVLAQVMYPLGYNDDSPLYEGTHYEEEEGKAEEEWKELEALQIEDTPVHRAVDDDDDDEEEEEDEDDAIYEVSYNASAIDTNFMKVLAVHKKMHAVGQIAWYIAMSMVGEELGLLSPNEWTRQRIETTTEQIWSAGNQEVIARTCALIWAVVDQGPCTLEVLRSCLPDEQRPNVLKLLQYHFTKIRVMLEDTKASIARDLDAIVESMQLTIRVENQPVYVPGPAPKTWLSDNCIPCDLKSKFVAEIAALENVPDEKKDWHPNSNRQVLNLVHPSLYCGVAWETRLLAASEAENLYNDPEVCRNK